MRYWNMVIWSNDQYYLDKMSEKYDIDYYDADIYLTEDTDSDRITNQLFYYVLYEAVNNLDISDNNKEYLQDSIYCNCLDSFYNIDSSNIDNIIEWSDKEKQIIKDFLDL